MKPFWRRSTPAIPETPLIPVSQEWTPAAGVYFFRSDSRSTFWSATITTNGGWHQWFAIPTGHEDGRLRG